LHDAATVGLLLFVCGACFTTYMSNSNARLQLGTPDHIRGRVLGIYAYAWNGPAPLAGPLIGWLCALGGTALAFGLGGVAALAATAVAAVVVGRGRSPVTGSDVEPAPREQLAASR